MGSCLRCEKKIPVRSGYCPGCRKYIKEIKRSMKDKNE